MESLESKGNYDAAEAEYDEETEGPEAEESPYPSGETEPFEEGLYDGEDPSQQVEDNLLFSQLNEDGEVVDLLKQVMSAKLKLAMLKRKRRLLLEEMHRQCLEGELEPKKRLKPLLDKCKKSKIHIVVPSN